MSCEIYRQFIYIQWRKKGGGSVSKSRPLNAIFRFPLKSSKNLLAQSPPPFTIFLMPIGLQRVGFNCRQAGHEVRFELQIFPSRVQPIGIKLMAISDKRYMSPPYMGKDGQCQCINMQLKKAQQRGLNDVSNYKLRL